MAQSVQKSMVAAIAGVSLLLLLGACSNNSSETTRQVIGNERYLDAPSLQELNVPEGVVLPIRNNAFDIPPVTRSGDVGKALDIRPPQLQIEMYQVIGNVDDYQDNPVMEAEDIITD